MDGTLRSLDALISKAALLKSQFLTYAAVTGAIHRISERAGSGGRVSERNINTHEELQILTHCGG
ncbi:hypothetical protein NDU88_001785, partial [Pleurodeles waltl]